MNLVLGKFDTYSVRSWARTDARSLATHANCRSIWANLRDGFPHPYGIADAERFITRALEMKPQACFAIACEEAAIGSIGLAIGSDVHRSTAELGYWIAEGHRGRGVATRAIASIAEYAFGELGLVRVFAEPFGPNSTSVRALEKCGFQYEGLMRRNVIKDGEFLDQHLLAIVNPDAGVTQPHAEGRE